MTQMTITARDTFPIPDRRIALWDGSPVTTNDLIQTITENWDSFRTRPIFIMISGHKKTYQPVTVHSDNQYGNYAIITALEATTGRVALQHDPLVTIDNFIGNWVPFAGLDLLIHVGGPDAIYDPISLHIDKHGRLILTISNEPTPEFW